MIRDALLAAGIVLATATQLRFGSTPVGPGELCLALWLGLALCRQAIRPTIVLNPALRALLAFWVVLIFAESVGAIVGLATETYFDVPAIAHDIVAHLLVLGVSCMAAIEFGSDRRRRRVTWMLVLFGAGCFSLQVAGAWGLIRLPFLDGRVEYWFFDRLQGWSADANQLGLTAAILTFISLHLVERATKMLEALVALACVSLAFFVGVLSKSDSYTVCVAAAALVFLTITGLAWVDTLRNGLTLKGISAVIVLLWLPMFVIAALPLTPQFVDRAQAYSNALYEQNNQGETRFNLWREALEKGLDSGMLGLGPGPHLTSKLYKRPPPDKL